MKQFESRKEMDEKCKELRDKFSEELTAEEWFLDDLDDKIAATLEAEGYDLNNLVADGDYYQISGHTNNGRRWRKELSINNYVSFEFEDEMKNFIKIHFIVDGVKIVAEGPSPEYFSFRVTNKYFKDSNNLEIFLNSARVERE